MANSSSAGVGNNTFRVEPPLAGIIAFLAALNIFLSITSSLGNALILIALQKVTSIYPPTKLLFRCLAVSDLCVGLISQPLFCITLTGRITDIEKNLLFYSDQLNTSSSFILFAVSILTSTAISVDRLLALLLGLRYRHVVTLRRVRAVITGIWLFSCALGGWRYSKWGIEASRIVLVVFMILCLLISISSYFKIYLCLHHNQLQVQGHGQQAQPTNGEIITLNIARYKKTVSSIAWVQLTILACYLPFSVVFMVFTHGKIRQSAFGMASFRVAISIIYLNSSLNPILYCWKIRAVKEATKNTITKLNCCKSN